MKKIILMVMILAFSLGITGCVKTGGETFETPYAGGNQGLIAEFEQMGAISDTTGANEVWADETFTVEVVLKNKGEKNVEPNDATISLKGIAPGDFTGLNFVETTNPTVIEKVSEYLPEGGEDRVTFGDAVSYVLTFDGFYDAMFQAELRYYYETYVAVPKACFKYNLREERVCNIDETKQYFVSGSPIQVTNVKQRPGGKGVTFLELDITNVGNGRSTTPGDDLKVEYDQISFQPINPASAPGLWTCTSGGKPNYAKLDQSGKATVRCKANVPVDALYTQQFSLILQYDYIDTFAQNLRIKEAI